MGRRGACNHSLKHLMPPPFSKMCQHVKMSNFSLSGFRLLTRVLEFVRLSLHRFDVTDTERFSGFEISTLKKSCRFCQKNLTCLGTKVPRVYLFNTVRNKELINATLSSDETLVLADVVSSLGCIFASF